MDGRVRGFSHVARENGFRYNDYYRSLAVARGCVANFEKAVTLMSPPEQQVRHVHSL